MNSMEVVEIKSSDLQLAEASHRLVSLFLGLWRLKWVRSSLKDIKEKTHSCMNVTQLNHLCKGGRENRIKTKNHFG